METNYDQLDKSPISYNNNLIAINYNYINRSILFSQHVIKLFLMLF